MIVNNSSTVTICREDVPLYLQDGLYFLSLDPDDMEPISVPVNSLKRDPIFETVSDLCDFLESLRYWACDFEPYEPNVVDFLLYSEISSTMEQLLAKYEESFPLIGDLNTVFTSFGNFESIMDKSAECGAFHLVHVLLRNGYKPTIDTFKFAISRRSRDTVELLVDEHYMRGSFSHLVPLCDEDMPCLEFLKKRGMWDGKNSMEKAASDGCIAGIRTLLRHQYTSRSACYFSAKAGHLDCLEYLHSQKSHLREKTSLIASTNGHLHILRFLHAKACLFDDYCCREASSNGHLDCLKFLHSIGRPWGVYVCSFAAKAGHLDCLQFAHENGCPWNEITCCDASQEGQAMCLHYAHMNGCPWDKRTTTNAVMHFSCLGYALENECAYVANLAEIAFKAMADESGFYVLQHCTNQSSSVFLYAAQQGRLDILNAAYNANIPWHADTCAIAAAAGHKDCLAFALARGAPSQGIPVICELTQEEKEVNMLNSEQETYFS